MGPPCSAWFMAAPGKSDGAYGYLVAHGLYDCLTVLVLAQVRGPQDYPVGLSCERLRYKEVQLRLLLK